MHVPKLELSSQSRLETAATPGTVLDSRPIITKILVTCFTSFVNCLFPPWRWHCRSYSGIPTTKKSGLEAMLSSWRRSWVLCTPRALVPISLTFHIAGIWESWMIPFLTASWIQSTFPDKCFTFPVLCLIANWRPEEESVNSTCSTSALKTNSKQRLKKIPSLRVLIMACSSLSQLDKLTTLWVLDDPKRNAPFNRCTPQLVDLRWVWLALQSLSLKLSRIQCLSEDFHRPCPPMGTHKRTQYSGVVFKYSTSFLNLCKAVRAGLAIDPDSSFTVNNKSGLSRARYRHVPATERYAKAWSQDSSADKSSVWISPSHGIDWFLILTFPNWSSNNLMTFSALVPGKSAEPLGTLLLHFTLCWESGGGLKKSCPQTFAKCVWVQTITNHQNVNHMKLDLKIATSTVTKSEMNCCNWKSNVNLNLHIHSFLTQRWYGLAPFQRGSKCHLFCKFFISKPAPKIYSVRGLATIDTRKPAGVCKHWNWHVKPRKSRENQVPFRWTPAGSHHTTTQKGGGLGGTFQIILFQANAQMNIQWGKFQLKMHKVDIDDV